MATTTSAATGQPYGVKRVCQVWGVPRGEQDPVGADVPGQASQRHAFRAGPCDGEGQLQFKAPGSSLFHELPLMLTTLST